MKKSEVNRTAQRSGERERGFSMLELAVVIGIIMVIAATALFEMGPAMESARANSAMQMVVEQLRSAREQAITYRRWVQVTFPVVVVNGKTQSQIQIIQRNGLTLGAGADVAERPVPIQFPMQFYVFPAPLPDTPDNFGNASPVYFGGVANGPIGGILFDGNGQLVSGATLLPMNGSVFIGDKGHNETARAVTVMGTTGRIRGWSSTGTGWRQF